MSGKAKPTRSRANRAVATPVDQFRRTQPRRTKLPESLGQAAVELARQHGVYSVAQPPLLAGSMVGQGRRDRERQFISQLLWHRCVELGQLLLPLVVILLFATEPGEKKT